MRSGSQQASLGVAHDNAEELQPVDGDGDRLAIQCDGCGDNTPLAAQEDVLRLSASGSMRSCGKPASAPGTKVTESKAAALTKVPVRVGGTIRLAGDPMSRDRTGGEPALPASATGCLPP